MRPKKSLLNVISVSPDSQGGKLESSLDTIETSATERESWINRKLAYMAECGKKVVLMLADKCLRHSVVPIRCHSPLCPTCARLEQEQTLRKYKPVLIEAKKSSRYALFITFTIKDRPKNGDELRAVFRKMSDAYRKLLDMRLGVRKRAQLKKMFLKALESSGVRDKNYQLRLFHEFLRFCEENKVCKFRDLIKLGVRRPEITYNSDKHWFNPHFHVIWFTDCPIPQVLLSLLWQMLTGSGIVDIRQAYGNFEKELIKYMTKFWEIPEKVFGEVLWGLRYMKKILIHGVKLLKEPKICSNCGDPDCKAHAVGIACLRNPISYRYKHGDTWEGELIFARGLFFDSGRVVVLYTEDEGFIWDIPDLKSFDLSVKFWRRVKKREDYSLEELEEFLNF